MHTNRTQLTTSIASALLLGALGCTNSAKVEPSRETKTSQPTQESNQSTKNEILGTVENENFLEATNAESELALNAVNTAPGFPPIVQTFVTSFGTPKALCSPEKRAKILAPRTDADKNVGVNCSLELKATETITKDILISGEEASGVSINCNGGAIGNANNAILPVFINSIQKSDNSWSRPKDVVISNCKIYGQIRIFGMAHNGQGEKLKESSPSLGHIVRARNAAPTHILLRNNVITTSQPIPVYISPGTTYVALISSKLVGQNESVALYLDAESGHNVFFNNVFSVNSTRREQVAIDSSSHNYFANNWLSNTDTGGMYLYRNCGEGGTVRHQAPSHNILLNNIFYYNTYNGELPSIWVGSRNGSRSFCGEDSAIQMGSGASDLDYAQFNVIGGNQIYKLNPTNMIRLNSQPNFLSRNVTVTADIKRQPGCVSHTTKGAIYTPYGENVEGATCTGQILPLEKPGDTRVPFSCSIESNSAGCKKTTQCPAGKTLVALRALCQLEVASLPAAEYSVLDWNEFRVARAADKTPLQPRGSCNLNNINLEVGNSSTIPLNGSQSVAYGCRDHDENGGDCIIKGELLCR